jgi:rhodanese-related sulfurtransferase
MEPRVARTWARSAVAATVLLVLVAIGDDRSAAAAQPADRFEMVRARIEAWTSSVPVEEGIVSSSDLKHGILDDWDRQQTRFQILSVRATEDDSVAGHVPHAVNVYWPMILTAEGRARIDSTRTVIVCCYFGHASMLCSTLLGLLGYRCRSLDFGMMGWNREGLVKAPWDRAADYPVAKTPEEAGETYPLPVLTGEERDATSLIRRRAQEYLMGEGSPVIGSTQVKAIVDDWDHKQAGYQIVSVESRQAYGRGHVPHALDIPLARIARVENLRRLDPRKTLIVYSDNGQTGQRAATLLHLLGYNAVAMKFGMMDWNMACVRKSRLWQDAAGYTIERGGTSSP